MFQICFGKSETKLLPTFFFLRQRGNCISVLSSQEQPACAFGSASGESSAGTDNALSYKGALKTVTRVHVHPRVHPDEHLVQCLFLRRENLAKSTEHEK